jgi:hypothetical protein
MKNDDSGEPHEPRSIPIEFIQNEVIAAAIAGMLNDWKTDSLRIGALGEGPRRPSDGRRGASPQCGEG